VDAQPNCKLVIELYGQQVRGAGCKRLGDGAAAWADLDDCAAGQVADGGCDTLDGLRIDEEVLAELGLDGHLLH